MNILIFIGKVSLYWVLFYACYLLFLRRQTFFIWNRFYLIAALIISFALPFIIYPESAPALPVIYEITSQPFTVSTVQAETPSLLTLTNMLWFVYAIGAVISGFKLYRSIRQLSGLLHEGERIELEDCTVILIDSDQVGSFSFLKWIVINRSDYENHFDAILRHEMIHVGQKHSYDILWIEFLKIIFWFNPILIFYKNAIQEVHEYLADEAAPNRETYAMFLVSYALNAPIASLTNHFFKPSQIKARIRMIYKNRSSKWLLSTYMITLLSVGLIALVVAGCEQIVETETPADNEKKSSKLNARVTSQPSPQKVFTVVEEQPEFPGGIKAMYDFLGRNVHYPEAAAKANVSGRVFLSFVVSETGEISDILVLKGIGFGCDEEAVRVLKSFPKWVPGKQGGLPVNVRYNLPINFELTDGQPEIVSKLPETRVQITQNGPAPMYVVNGVIITDTLSLKKIDPDNIQFINVRKGESATEAYGEKGKNGVIEIKTTSL
ncbi:hypothetical protein DYBT9275_04195 [Dyadobacter sp. CECT 9275]|uniref:TonB C-terminal domain-containing protein n=1 Tax=Dyadobacter helix TaxID=2822344 RepID=A0A916JG19_9BACT|nr:M56 family metallopeptidase [Dyadobacter sp. CECT 9275]CAG5008111.1 hypothetical protein DYBT9275_04195 [Dyadobacter sp. CECT 9275]